MVHLFWIIPVTLLAGAQLASYFEYKLKYNLTDEELDLLKSLEAKAKGAEKAVIAKIKGWL